MSIVRENRSQRSVERVFIVCTVGNKTIILSVVKSLEGFGRAVVRDLLEKKNYASSVSRGDTNIPHVKMSLARLVV